MPTYSALTLLGDVRIGQLTADLACKRRQFVKAAALQHALSLYPTLRAGRNQVLAKCMHAGVKVRAGSDVLVLLCACIGVRACNCADVHAGSEAESCRPDRESDGSGEHQPSNSASAAGGTLASAQKPEPAPAGPGGAESAAHAAELSGWLD